MSSEKIVNQEIENLLSGMNGSVPSGDITYQSAPIHANLEAFPSWALQPRTETGAKQFLSKFPNNDGRGTIIAILDSGVDPGAGGLAKTSDGKQKIIERIDCSGAGDVDMSREVSPDKDGFIEGLTGRKLKIPICANEDSSGWINPTGKYRIGVKRAMELYPRSLRERMIKERQEKLWDPFHKKTLADTARKINELDVSQNNSSNNSSKSANSEDKAAASSGGAGNVLNAFDKLVKENLDSELETLVALDKKFRDNSGSATSGDVGPIFDIISWYDGTHWNVVIDTSEEGDLSRENIPKLRPFSETFEYAKLTDQDKLNVSINIYEKGSIVQIVSVCSSHGTHVASIASANFSGEGDKEPAPEKNGLAPGAQIISLSIGDGRLTSMETGTALSRAMTYIMQRNKDTSKQKVDVINMSYGEYSHWSNTGRVGELMHEVINKYGVVWVASAGNNGPALCTVGTPPDIATNSVIGVGAYVSPEMMVALYSTREKLPGTPYTWSSRGPTIDGERGVTICAPGGAITSVPPFNLRCSQLMNGTSMASPHVCGAVSMLISGLKQENLKWSPFSIKRALAATARPLPHLCPYGQGHGLLQIEAAFGHLIKYNDSIDRDVRFAVTCGNSGGSKGIHLRGNQALKPAEIPVKVDPVFMDSDNIAGDLKVAFNMKFALTCSSPSIASSVSSSWVKHPEHLDLMYVSRHFLVAVDPTGLPPGVHSAYVAAYDVTAPNKGAVFEIPITIVKPESLTLDAGPRPTFVMGSIPSTVSNTMSGIHGACSRQVASYSGQSVVFQPNNIRRHFLMVPDKATWAVIKVRSHESNAVGKFVLHTVQLLPKTIVKVLENHKMFTLNEQGEWSHGIAVRGGYVLEVCLAKWWANIGNVECSYSVTFHGLTPEGRQQELCFHGADSILRLDVSTGLSSEEVAPEIKLKSCVQNYRPVEAKVVPLGERDIIPDCRNVYELQLTYNFSIGKGAEITPNLSLLSDVLYESEFESQLWMLYNSNKQFVACGDAYPSRWSVKVEKDDYILRAHVRHEKKDILDKMMDISMALSVKISSPITLEVYTSFANASTASGKKVNSSGFTLSAGKTLPLYIVAPSANDKHAKNAVIGQYLQGTMTLAKDEFGKKADVYPVKYILNEPAKREKSSAKKNTSKNSETPTLEDTIFEAKTTWLGKMDPDSDESANLYQTLLDEKKIPAKGICEKVDAASEEKERKKTSTSVLQVNMARLTSLEMDKKLGLENITPKRAEEAIRVCNLIIDEIGNPDDILAFFAIKTDSRSDAAEIKKEMERKKGWYLDATSKKGIALCAIGKSDEATQLLFDCLRFVEQSDSKVIFFSIVHAEKIGHYGRAIKLSQSFLESSSGSGSGSNGKPSDDIEVFSNTQNGSVVKSDKQATIRNGPSAVEVDNLMTGIYHKLNWEHIYRFAKLSQPIRFPSGEYDMF